MTERPVYLPMTDNAPPADSPFVRTILIAFEWTPGRSSAHQRKRIAALHAAAIMELKPQVIPANGRAPRLLEVSTHAGLPLGRQLSAFNLSGSSRISVGEMEAEIGV